MALPRFLVGIDLGTTNCALAYIDTLQERPETRILSIPQLRAPGQLEEALTMPSCCYIASPEERKRGTLRLAWQSAAAGETAVGIYAYAQLAATPSRVVQSAKSWLCHGDVDREAPILPWGSEEVAAAHKLSPVAVSSCYLRHLHAAWNASIGAHNAEYRLER